MAIIFKTPVVDTTPPPRAPTPAPKAPAPDQRRQYFEELETVDRYRERAFEYDKEALQIAGTAFRALTYLNGGALVATPTAVKLFGANVAMAKVSLLCAALSFVAGLVLVIL